MRTKRRILLASVLLVLAFIIALLLWPSSEPSYNGKSLHEWIRQYEGEMGFPFRAEARDALRHIGTNAIPTLLSMTAVEYSAVRMFMYEKCPDPLANRFGIGEWLAENAKLHHNEPERANTAFKLLGSSASNAVPGLIRILKTSKNRHNTAMRNLGCIGPVARDALPDMVQHLADPKASPYEIVSWVDAISSIASESGKWQPDCLHILVPALTDALNDTNAATLRVLVMLEKIGPDAKSAIPAIQPFLTSTNSEISAWAAQALKTIDPAAIQKPEIK